MSGSGNAVVDKHLSIPLLTHKHTVALLHRMEKHLNVSCTTGFPLLNITVPEEKFGPFAEQNLLFILLNRWKFHLDRSKDMMKEKLNVGLIVSRLVQRVIRDLWKSVKINNTKK